MKNKEPEDFSKIVTFTDKAFAIVDASVIKALKNVPMVDQAIFVPLKTNLEGPTFKIEARYDDATLRKLVITPAPDEKEEDPSAPEVDGMELNEFSVSQPRGHGGDGPARQLAQALQPKATREKRNALYSKGAKKPGVDPANKLKGKQGKVGKVQKGGGNKDESHRAIDRLHSKRGKEKRAKMASSPFVDSVCKLLACIKEHKYDEEQIVNIPGRNLFVEALKVMRARCFGGWKLNDGLLVNEDGYTADPDSWDLEGDFIRHKGGKKYDFDLIYEALQVLDKPGNIEESKSSQVDIDPEEAEMFNRMILRRLNLDH